METAIQKATAKVMIVTPILDMLNPMLTKEFGKNVPEIAADLSKVLERGVKTPKLLAEANTIALIGNRAMKFKKETQLSYTRPIVEGQKEVIKGFDSAFNKIEDPLERVNKLVMDRDAELKAEERRRQEEAEAAQLAADEKARKETERNRNISLGKGGTGEVKIVEPEKINQPISIIAMTNPIRTKRIPDKDAIQLAVDKGLREIPGVKIKQIWVFDITEAKKVPDEYRKTVRA